MRDLGTLCTQLGATFVSAPQPASVRFSVCTLVRSEANYARLLASFQAHGFSRDNTEFVALDNRDENRFDGYSALRAVLPRLQGEYILFTHDDIELETDGATELVAVLEDLTRRDANWMIAGNAGFSMPGQGLGMGLGLELGDEVISLRHLDDIHSAGDRVDQPVQTQSLDENFLVLRRSQIVLPSIDLDGFHLFATDLCLQAEFLGGTAYVIPFLLRHHSGGASSADFDRTLARFRRKYRRYMSSRIIRAQAATIAFNVSGEVKIRARAALNQAMLLPQRVRRKVRSITRRSAGPNM